MFENIPGNITLTSVEGRRRKENDEIKEQSFDPFFMRVNGSNYF